MSDGIQIGIGKDGSSLTDSNVRIGNVAGGDIRVTKRSGGNSALGSRIDDLEQDIDALAAKVFEIEKALGGQFGVGGVVPEVKQISMTLAGLSSDIKEMKQSMRADRHQEKRWATAFLIVATILFLLSVYMSFKNELI